MNVIIGSAIGFIVLVVVLFMITYGKKYRAVKLFKSLTRLQRSLLAEIAINKYKTRVAFHNEYKNTHNESEINEALRKLKTMGLIDLTAKEYYFLTLKGEGTCKLYAK